MPKLLTVLAHRIQFPPPNEGGEGGGSEDESQSLNPSCSS